MSEMQKRYHLEIRNIIGQTISAYHEVFNVRFEGQWCIFEIGGEIGGYRNGYIDERPHETIAIPAGVGGPSDLGFIVYREV